MAALSMSCQVFVACLLFVSSSLALAPSGPWDTFNYAPSSRIVSPAAIHSTNGSVDGASNLVNGTTGNATLSGNGSYVVLDFGKEVRDSTADSLYAL